MEENRNLTALFTLKHKLKIWLREGEALIQIIDALLPANHKRPLSIEQMRKERREALFGKDHAKKVSHSVAKRHRNP